MYIFVKIRFYFMAHINWSFN